MAATMASPIPVLPAVASTSVSPGIDTLRFCSLDNRECNAILDRASRVEVLTFSPDHSAVVRADGGHWTNGVFPIALAMTWQTIA